MKSLLSIAVLLIAPVCAQMFLPNQSADDAGGVWCQARLFNSPCRGVGIGDLGCAGFSVTRYASSGTANKLKVGTSFANCSTNRSTVTGAFCRAQAEDRVLPFAACRKHKLGWIFF